MNCKHPEAFVSIKNGKRICGLCGAVVPVPVEAPAEEVPEKEAPAEEAPEKEAPAEEKPAPKKGGKANARK